MNKYLIAGVLLAAFQSPVLAEAKPEVCDNPIITMNNSQYDFIDFFLDDLPSQAAIDNYEATIIAHLGYENHDAARIDAYIGSTDICYDNIGKVSINPSAKLDIVITPDSTSEETYRELRKRFLANGSGNMSAEFVKIRGKFDFFANSMKPFLLAQEVEILK